MDAQSLALENQKFADTFGISQNNRGSGFVPAFRDRRSGRVELARWPNGDPAPVHMISGLPREWATSISEDGSIQRLRPDIVSGFVRDGAFYTREQTAGF